MAKHLVILDVQYLFASASFNSKWLDLVKLVQLFNKMYAPPGSGNSVEMAAYLLNNKEEPSRVEAILTELNVTVSVKKVTARPSQVSPTTHDVKITLDVVDRLPLFDVLVLCAGKAGYTDLVQRCRMYKKEVHVWGFDFSLAKQLVTACDQVFSLEKFSVLEESRVNGQ